MYGVCKCVCEHIHTLCMYMEVTGQLLGVGSLLPCHCRSLLLFLLCCVLKASWPVSLRVIIVSLPPISPQECWDCRYKTLHPLHESSRSEELGGQAHVARVFYLLRHLVGPKSGFLSGVLSKNIKHGIPGLL